MARSFWHQSGFALIAGLLGRGRSLFVKRKTYQRIRGRRMETKNRANRRKKKSPANTWTPKAQRCVHCRKLCTLAEGTVCNKCYSKYTPGMLADLEE